MNKKGFLKALMYSFVVAITIGFLATNVLAQSMPTQIMMQLPYGLQVGDTVLLDNFEYWNTPRNMGWMAIEPAYPQWGAGIGYGQLQTVLDFEQGSRVLDVYRSASVFLPFGANSPYMPYTIQKGAAYMDDSGSTQQAIPGDFSMLSFKVRAPLALEQFDMFSFAVGVETSCGSVTINLTPRDKSSVCPADPADTVDEVSGGLSDGDVITVWVGKQFGDLTWHIVMVDLAKVIEKADDTCTLDEITGIVVRGNQYRLDDIMFTKPECSAVANNAPYLFRIGPVYAQMWNMQDMRFVFAEDEDLGIHLDPETGNFAAILDASGNAHGDAAFDCTDRPLQLRNRGANDNCARPNILWRWTVGGSLGQCTAGNLAVSIPVDPNNLVVPFLPKLGAPMGACGMPIGQWVVNTGTKDCDNDMYVLACALADAGYQAWPTVQVLRPSMGQVAEDLIITARVSDNASGFDMETFPISVVNYDVTNHPPMIEQLEDQIFQVGQQGVYGVTAMDYDIQDMFQLTYRATLNGVPSYQYGPWMQSIIHPSLGVVSFTPQFEGALTCVVTVMDPRGMSAVGSFTIFCTQPGTWFNHPPVVTQIIESPQSTRAGATFMISDLNIVDPDNEALYYSCNIGSVGANGVYNFQSNFPGTYLVQITAYDIRGGAVTQQFVLNVIPWWAY